VTRRFGVVLGLVALVLTVSACGHPVEGEVCDEVGSTESYDGHMYACQKYGSEPSGTPHWHQVR
jgi:hypothetical protein